MFSFIVLLLPLLVAAGFLRFYGLKKRGVLFWDDGLRLSELQYFEDLLNFITKNFAALKSKKIFLKEAEPRFRGLYLNDTNPLHIPLYYLTGKLTGNMEISGLVTNAVFGLAGIVGVFALGTVMFNPMVGLCAAFVLTFFCYHLIYCRSYQSEVTCGTFFIWGIYFYWLSLNPHGYHYLALAGLCIGFSFCCHSKKFYFPFFMFFYESAWYMVSGPSNWLPRMVVLSSGMFLPLMFFESVFMVLKLMGYPHRTFFRELAERTGQFARPNFKLPFLRFYLQTFYYMDGAIIPLLILIGLTYVLLKPSFQTVVLLPQVLVPFLFWITRPPATDQTAQVDDGSGSYVPPAPRFLSDTVYAGSILAAVPLYLISEKYFVFIPLLLAISATGSYKAVQLFKVKSGYKQVFEYMKAHGKLKHITLNHYISVFFSGRENMVPYNHVNYQAESVQEWFSRQPYRWFLFVPYLYKSFLKTGAKMIPPLEFVVNEAQPVYVGSEGMTPFKPLIFDQTYSYDYRIVFDDKIELFDLDAVKSKMNKPNHAGAQRHGE